MGVGRQALDEVAVDVEVVDRVTPGGALVGDDQGRDAGDGDQLDVEDLGPRGQIRVDEAPGCGALEVRPEYVDHVILIVGRVKPIQGPDVRHRQAREDRAVGG